MPKVLYVATVVKTHIMQFHVPMLKMFKEEGWQVDVAARNDYENPDDCNIPYCDNYYDIPFDRSPFSPKNIQAYKQLKKIIREGHYDIVHCHTPVGGVLTRLAARTERKNGTRVFYTAHGFHFYKGAPFINWLIYYPIEKLCARWTDVLITINKEDFELAKKKMKAKRVEYVPGVGIDFSRFKNITIDRNQKRKEIGLKENAFSLITVAELSADKNHQVVIKSLQQLPDDIEYVIVGKGVLLDELKIITQELALSNRVHFLGYRNDVSELYKACDVCVFPSMREGLGLAPIEALLSGLPLIIADNRGTREFSIDGENSIICTDINSYESAIKKMYCDAELRERLSSSDAHSLYRFSVEYVLSEMKRIVGI